MCVYILLHADVHEAQHALADTILCVEQKNLDTLVISPTNSLNTVCYGVRPGKGNVLDNCNITISSAHRAVPHAAVGQSDHFIVHLILANWQKLKLCKPAVRT